MFLSLLCNIKKIIMRILSELKKYDSTLTVAELIQKIELNKLEQEKTEELELIKIKEEFENTYLKEIEENELFGKALNIYHLKNFVRKERTENWGLLCYFEGRLVRFKKHSMFSKDLEVNRAGDGFSMSNLKNMVKITEEEYYKYADTCNSMTNELKNILSIGNKKK